ncbi:hypothetical protein DL93DRAFT_2081370 [Clavulina sp. PMI_390]|nr:hypothetical protein DL93DRAFT_2081370 [Clavulina sp. PMI_390]
MGTWSDLPTELALQVIKELSVPDGRGAARSPSHTTNLLSCTQVSHNFRAIADMVLYRDVRLILLDWSLIYPMHKATISYRQILCFTRAILLRPPLGKHVRQLFVSSLGVEWDEFESTLASWNEAVSEGEVEELLSDCPDDGPDLSIILKALEPLGLKTGLVRHGGADGLFITLLQLLPKLQSLSVEAKGPLNFIAYSCFGAFGGKIPAALQSIVELSISVDPVGDYDTDVRDSSLMRTYSDASL